MNSPVKRPPAYRRNGQSVSAEAFYAIACNPRRHLAVEACAGAGKTWMLVARMVRALLEMAQAADAALAKGDAEGARSAFQPESILAITFTKKAAGEMQTRLTEWLHGFSHMPDDKLAEQARIMGIEESASQPWPVLKSQLSSLQRRMLEAERGVQVRTFHGWFAALLKAAPLAVLQQLGLPSPYELLEDDADEIANVAPRLLQRIQADEALRADYLACVAAVGRHNTHASLQSAIGKRTELLRAHEAGTLQASVQTFQEAFPEFAALDDPAKAVGNGTRWHAALVQAARAMGAAETDGLRRRATELETALTNQDFDAVCRALLTAEGAPRKLKGKGLDADAVQAAQDALLRVMAAVAQRDAHEHHQRLVRLGLAYVAEYADHKRRRGLVDMADVEAAAHTLLATPELGGWLQQRLDARVRHLLIDEFQDTNPMQWQALSSWLSGYVGAGGGAQEVPRLFLVGDPKQSIYRFRRAEPQVFVAAQHFVVEGLHGDVLQCDHTRRNALAVIEAVNGAMGAAQADQQYDGFRDHTTASSDEGAVWALPPIDDDGEAPSDVDTSNELVWRDSLTVPRHEPEENRRRRECAQVAACIARLLHTSPPGSFGLNPDETLQPKHIMLMARKRERLVQMEEALRPWQIPCTQPEKAAWTDMPAVGDLLALLDALLSPANDLALAQALKSPLFGCSDADLAHIARYVRAGDRGQARQSWRMAVAGLATGDASWAAIDAQLTRWREALASLPPHDALQAIYDEAQVLQRFAAATPAEHRQRVLQSLQSLLLAALNLGGGRYATPYALVRALRANQLRIKPADEPDAVQLLTVHGAKGLEAPVVILLDTDALERRKESHLALVDWPGEMAAPARVAFLEKASDPPPSLQGLVDTDLSAQAREELNALYVALTRARHTLILSSSTPKKSVNPASWWHRLLPFAQPMQGWTRADGEVAPQPQPQAAMPMQAGGDANHFALPILPKYLGPAVAAARASAEVGAGDDANTARSARVGEAMHRLLEHVPLAASAPAAPLWLADVLRAVATEFACTPPEMLRAEQWAAGIRLGRGAWAWDSSKVKWAGNEVPLTVGGQYRRIDRLVCCDGLAGDAQWWVLDYKSKLDPLRDPALCTQLRDYARAVQRLYAGAEVRAAFLTPDGAVHELHL